MEDLNLSGVDDEVGRTGKPRAQVLLDQAADCIDAALREVAVNRHFLTDVSGMSNYSFGAIINRLADTAGTIATVQRMLPGWNPKEGS